MNKLNTALLFFAVLIPSLFSAQVFTTVPQNWQRDIDFLNRELPTRHPNLFKKYPRKNWDADIENLKENLTGKSDLQIALSLQEIIAKCGDPGTTLDLSSILQREKVIPLGYGWYDGELYISASVKRFAKLYGAKILKINGLKPLEAIDQLARFVPRHNDVSYRNPASFWLRFPVAFRMAGLSTTDTLEIEATTRKGENVLMKIYPLDKYNDQAGMIPVVPTRDAPDLRFRPLRTFWTKEWHEADSLLLFQYSRCASREISLEQGDSLRAEELPPFGPERDSMLLFLKTHPSARLLFDLRFNPGGSPSDILKLIEALAADQDLNKKGRIFVATNSYTHGAAVELAFKFDQQTEAILVGEPTGGKPNFYGTPRDMVLPNSGVKLTFSTQYIENLPKKDPDTLRPEETVPLTLEDFIVGKDPVLQFIKKYKS